jgi:uncharacterized protein (TIGR00369 family)
MPMTVADAEALLEEAFAPWIREMGIAVLAVGDGTATLQIAPSVRLNRIGGTLCGQAMMALADTAMVFAVAGASGGFVPMATIGQNTAFLRAPGAAPVTAEARLIRKGRQVVYGEVTLHDGDPARPVAHATSTYMLLPG